MSSNISMLRLQDAWRECERNIYHLCRALTSLAPILPMTRESFEHLTDAQVQSVDQFILCFTKLQDAMGNRLFPAILQYLQGQYEERPMLDKLNRLEKLRYIQSAEAWQSIRNTRNKFAYDYPDDWEKNVALIAEGFAIFAKSPQALVFDNFVRIYFCSKKTANGKYLSCPQYVDLNKNFDKILRVSQELVVELGKLGEFDEHGIFPLNVLKHEGKIFAYTSGWSRRTSVPIDMSIGLAISEDNGLSFKKFGSGGPVMAATHNEPFLVGDPFVKYLNGSFHMWYIFGINWNRPTPDSEAERFYKIVHVESIDGINWIRDGKPIIVDKLSNECQALPTVIYAGGRYHMYFCYRNAYDFRNNKNNSYRLGYAFSDDLISWQRDDAISGIDVTEGAWDSAMMCYPNIFECDGTIYLLYNGNEFGRCGFGIAKLISL